MVYQLASYTFFKKYCVKIPCFLFCLSYLCFENSIINILPLLTNSIQDHYGRKHLNCTYVAAVLAGNNLGYVTKGKVDTELGKYLLSNGQYTIPD